MYQIYLLEHFFVEISKIHLEKHWIYHDFIWKDLKNYVGGKDLV